MDSLNKPTYYQTGPPSQGMVQKEHVLHLYLHQFMVGPNTNQIPIVLSRLPNEYGRMGVNDWTIRDGPSSNDNLIARVQGLYTVADSKRQNYFFSDNILFTDERYNGSTLAFLGNFDAPVGGNWAIVGGTGEFACAQGVISYKLIEDVGQTGGTIWELNIRALSLTMPEPNPVTPVNKTELLGGKGGKAFDISDQPWRLESLTIRSGDVIDSIAFSYVDQAGKKQTAGPWGGDGGLSRTISLAPTETVNKVFGTIGVFGTNTVITSLRIVTNANAYGPFGKETGTPFSIPKENDKSILGLFARAGLVIDAIGAYVGPSATN